MAGEYGHFYARREHRVVLVFRRIWEHLVPQCKWYVPASFLFLYTYAFMSSISFLRACSYFLEVQGLLSQKEGDCEPCSQLPAKKKKKSSGKLDVSVPTVGCTHSPQLRFTVEGLFWLLPPLSSWPQWPRFFENRRCPPPSVSSLKRFLITLGPSRLKLLGFLTQLFHCREAGGRLAMAEVQVRVHPSQAGSGRASTNG